MSAEFLVSRSVEIPEPQTPARWERTSDAIGQLRLEVERLRATQPVEVPVENHRLNDVPVEASSSNE